MTKDGTGNWRNDQTHQAWCRTCMRRKDLDGVELVRWFFEPSTGRRGRAWKTRQIAKVTFATMPEVWIALRAAQREGLVELTKEGWRWTG